MSLPRFVVLKSIYNNKYLRYIHEDVQVHGFLQFSGKEVLSAYAKFEVEMAKSGNGLVHIRCCYNNKYWVRWTQNHWWIVAGADEPEEDQSKWSCTLFKPIYLDADAKTVRFLDVQLGHYACLWRAAAPYESCLYAGSENPDQDSCDVYRIIDWESLLIIRKTVGVMILEPSSTSKAVSIVATDSAQKTASTHKSADKNATADIAGKKAPSSEATKAKTTATEAAKARAAPTGATTAKPVQTLKRTQPPSYRTVLEKVKKAIVVHATPLAQQEGTSTPISDPVTQTGVVARVAPSMLDSSPTHPRTKDSHSSTGNLWEKGVTGELFKIAKAPARLLESRRFGDADYEELERIEENAFKCASLVQTFSSLQHRYIILVEELEASQEENKKIHEELLSAQAENKKLKEELLAENKKLREELLASQISNTSLQTDLERVQASLEAAEQREAQQTSNYNDLKVALEDKIWAAEAEITSMGDTLASAVEEAFNNTLEQVRCLNPGVELITAGMHYLSYVEEGRIVPPSLPEDSAVPMNEDPTPEEEATSTRQPDSQPPSSKN